MDHSAAQPFSTISDFKSSAHLKEIQEKFLRNERPDECSRCWQDEAAGIISKRQMFVEKNHTLESTKYITLPLGRTCNLACSTCSPWSSSKWSTEMKKYPAVSNIVVPGVHNYLANESVFNDVTSLFPTLTEIELHGGEPLYSKEHLPVLLKLLPYAENIKLRYITNCTIFPTDEIVSYWRKFKEVDILMSIDGTGATFEYTRWPANWDQVLTNIMKFNDLGFVQLSISHTVSIFNVLDIDEFTNWSETNIGITPYYGMVAIRMPLNITSFPPHIKQEISNQILNNQVIEYMNSIDNSHLWDQSKLVIKAYDTIRHTPISNYLPKLDRLLKSNGIVI